MTVIRNAAPSSLLISDPLSRCHYLVDTDAELSIVSVSRNYSLTPQSLKLAITNSLSISTATGYWQIDMNLVLRRAFSWRFVIASINSLILEADFMRH